MITDLPTKRVSSITATKISRRFIYKMAAKNGGHGYETKLSHCHRMCINVNVLVTLLRV